MNNPKVKGEEGGGVKKSYYEFILSTKNILSDSGSFFAAGVVEVSKSRSFYRVFFFFLRLSTWS